ncbi:MAG: hypothetical protein ABIE74_06040 [Pseudomonadota bacterium]
MKAVKMYMAVLAMFAMAACGSASQSDTTQGEGAQMNLSSKSSAISYADAVGSAAEKAFGNAEMENVKSGHTNASKAVEPQSDESDYASFLCEPRSFSFDVKDFNVASANGGSALFSGNIIWKQDVSTLMDLTMDMSAIFERFIVGEKFNGSDVFVDGTAKERGNIRMEFTKGYDPFCKGDASLDENSADEVDITLTGKGHMEGNLTISGGVGGSMEYNVDEEITATLSSLDDQGSKKASGYFTMKSGNESVTCTLSEEPVKLDEGYKLDCNISDETTSTTKELMDDVAEDVFRKGTVKTKLDTLRSLLSGQK